MSKFTRHAVLAAGMLSLLSLLSASAGAVTWDNSGGTAFTATGGAHSLSSTSATWVCPGADMTGDAPNNVVGLTYSIKATLSFTGCVLGGITTSVDCGLTLTAFTQTGAAVTGRLDLDCSMYQFGSKFCAYASNTLHAIYTNPAAVGAAGSLTVTTGTVTTSNGASGTCPLGNGDLAHLTHMQFATSANAPLITRTA